MFAAPGQNVRPALARPRKLCDGGCKSKLPGAGGVPKGSRSAPPQATEEETKMKKLLVGVGLSLVLAAFVACAQGGTQSTPTAVDNAALTSVSAEQRAPHNKLKICHHDADLSEGAYEWTVIEVNYNSVSSHCTEHDDFMSTNSFGCSLCDSQYLEVGADCGACPYLAAL